MNLVDFAEKTSLVPLSEWQKKFLTFYGHAKKEYKPIVAIATLRINGRQMLIEIIREFEKEQVHGENHTSERKRKDNKVNSNIT